LLAYGDNGSGKSSITDAIEWFYNDKIEHLAKAEIEKEALKIYFSIR
jgi:chromosome segregation ATPase